MKESFRCCTMAALLSLYSGSLFAAPVQPLDAVADEVKRFVQAAHQDSPSLEVQVASLDQRLRLPNCEQPLHSQWAQGSPALGRVTVQVRCEGQKPWRLHVQATATRELQVWALQRPVRAGEVLEPGMFEVQRVRAGNQSLRGLHYGEPVETLAPWEGFEFAQAARPGQILTDRMLKAPRLVTRGELVRVVLQANGLSIATRGVALSDATRNEPVQVRNERSGKVFSTIVTDRSTVEVR